MGDRGYGLEPLYHADFNGPPHTDTRSDQGLQWAGRNAISSGSSTVTVSTTVVRSDSIILATARTAVSSLGPIRVSTISPLTSFTLAAPAAVAEDAVITWFMFRSVPFQRLT